MRSGPTPAFKSTRTRHLSAAHPVLSVLGLCRAIPLIRGERVRGSQARLGARESFHGMTQRCVLLLPALAGRGAPAAERPDRPAPAGGELLLRRLPAPPLARVRPARRLVGATPRILRTVGGGN